MPERATSPTRSFGRPRSSIAAVLAGAVERLDRVVGGRPQNARREAMALWAAVAGSGVKPGDVWLRRDDEPDPALAGRFWEAVERRSHGFPFAYAVGRAAFRTLDLRLDRRALIPRPETEGLVDLVLDRTGRVERGTCGVRRGRVERGGGVAADVGTGTGCIALSLALEGDFDRVIAVERSPEAAALARENVALVAPPVPVDVREGDLLAPLAGERCRAIVSNPPYLTEAEYRGLEPAVRRFEPREALVGGADGLDATRALLAGARDLLEPGGLLAVEIDERRAEPVRALARAHGWARVGVHHDLFGRPRFLVAFESEDA